MSEPQQSFIVNIPRDYDANQRLAIGREIIRFIQQRTRGGLDKSNRPFRKYSEGYSRTFDFRVAGKDKDRPNLELSGDMLVDLEILSHGVGFITIGYRRNNASNDKAAWVQKEERGGRKFLGISQGDLQEILNRFPVQDRFAAGLAAQLDEQLTSSIISRILGRG